MRSAPVLGLDLGGTNVKAGVVDVDGRVLSSVCRPAGERLGLDAWVAAGLEAARDAMAKAHCEPVSLGLAVPGAVDPLTCRLVDLVDRLPSAEGLDLAAAFAPLGLAVAADNDARAALQAERRWGGHGDIDDLVVLTFGTGIGGAAIVGGRPPGGERVLAGNQLGHLTIEIGGARCVCGNRGCAETVASATAIVADARTAGLDAADAAAVFAAETEGSEIAAALIDRFLDGVVATIVNAVHAYQPTTVVLTGGLMASASRILPTVLAAVTERAWTLPRGRVRIELSTLSSDAGVLAGAAVALDARAHGVADAPRSEDRR